MIAAANHLYWRHRRCCIGSRQRTLGGPPGAAEPVTFDSGGRTVKGRKMSCFPGFFAEHGPVVAIPRLPYFTVFSMLYHHFSDTSLTRGLVSSNESRNCSCPKFKSTNGAVRQTHVHFDGGDSTRVENLATYDAMSPWSGYFLSHDAAAPAAVDTSGTAASACGLVRSSTNRSTAPATKCCTRL